MAAQSMSKTYMSYPRLSKYWQLWTKASLTWTSLPCPCFTIHWSDLTSNMVTSSGAHTTGWTKRRLSASREGPPKRYPHWRTSRKAAKHPYTVLQTQMRGYDPGLQNHERHRSYQCWHLLHAVTLPKYQGPQPEAGKAHRNGNPQIPQLQRHDSKWLE